MALNPITSVAQALDLLTKAVAERGESYVYPGRLPSDPEFNVEADMCKYVFAAEGEQDRRPGCIIGLVLYLNGWTLDELDSFEGKNSWRIGEDLDFDPDANEILFAAQRAQDGRQTWGEALKAAQFAAQRIASEKATGSA